MPTARETITQMVLEDVADVCELVLEGIEKELPLTLENPSDKVVTCNERQLRRMIRTQIVKAIKNECS